MKHVWSSRHAPEPVGDRFAHALGFVSYLDLFEASTPITSSDGRAWFATRLRGDDWIVWNDHNLSVEGHYKTKDEALAHITDRRPAAQPLPRVG